MSVALALLGQQVLLGIRILNTLGSCQYSADKCKYTHYGPAGSGIPRQFATYSKPKARDRNDEEAFSLELSPKAIATHVVQSATFDDLFAHSALFHLQTLRISNFKRFKDITLTFVPNPVVIVGANGAGKTQGLL
jgi:hypothetical protein